MLLEIDDVDTAINTAAALCERARWEESLALLERLLRREEDPLVRCRLKLAKAKALNDLDWARGLRNPAAKHEILDDVETVAKDRFQWAYAMALFQRGMALHLEFIMSTGDTEYELDCFTRAAELFAAEGDIENAALATAFVGIFYHVDMLDRDRAVPYLQQAYDMAPVGVGSEARSEASRHLGQILQELGDIAAAIPLLEESLAARAEAGATRHLASALHALGFATLELGDFDRARDYLTRARHLAEQHGSALFLPMIIKAEAELELRAVTGPNVWGRTHP